MSKGRRRGVAIMVPVFFVAVFLLSFTHCSSSSSSSGSGSLTLVLKSTALTRHNHADRTACTVSVNGSSQSGNCFTPYSVSATFSRAGLANTSGGAPVRVLGGGDKYHGIQDVFRKESMDLRAVPSVDGDDNIQDGTAASYNLLNFDVTSLETVFVATTAAKYYHVRTFFVDQPPSTATAFSSCGLSAGTLAEIDTQGTLFTGMTGMRGDILVCVKDAATDTCAASDYAWVDSVGSLVTTRPGSPKRLTGTYLTGADACTAARTAEEAHADITWGNLTLPFGISTPIEISAEFVKGVKNYTQVVGGTTKKGTKLTVTADVDLEEGLFAHSSSSITDLSTVTESTLLNNIDKVTLKPVYVENNKNSSSSADGSSMTANVTLAVE